MKKLLLIGSLLLLSLALSGFYLWDRQLLASPNTSCPTPTPVSGLTIGIIGDSWAAGKKLDSIIANRLVKAGIQGEIFSSGHPGAPTKEVYNNLFKPESDKHSTQFILAKRPTYCVVVAGVNDSQGQRGKEFYAHHLQLITKSLLACNIKPIIVTLPEYGIEDRYLDLDILTYIRFRFFAWLNNNSKVDNIQQYRAEAMKVLKPFRNQILLADFDKVCTDFHSCKSYFLPDHIHLSMAGRQQLGCVVAETIIGDMKNE